MKTNNPPPVSLTPAERFRPLIKAAIATGADLSHQVLQLTHGDAAKLRRDPAVADEEIRFDGGVMSFLGVRILEGRPTSMLGDEGGLITPAQSPEEVAPTVKAQKKSSSKVRKPKVGKPKPPEAPQISE